MSSEKVEQQPSTPVIKPQKNPIVNFPKLSLEGKTNHDNFNQLNHVPAKKKFKNNIK